MRTDKKKILIGIPDPEADVFSFKTSLKVSMGHIRKYHTFMCVLVLYYSSAMIYSSISGNN